MKVILFRHAQTAGNLLKLYHGRTDEPLCEEGFLQARQAGLRPEVSRVFVSPLLRARQTAAVCFPNAEQTVLPGLREMDFGDFEGRSAAEMADDPAYRSWVDGLCVASCPRGESMADVCARVSSALDTAVRGASERGEERLYLVAHGGSIMAAMSLLTNRPDSFADWHVRHCCGWLGVLREAERGCGAALSAVEFFEKLPT